MDNKEFIDRIKIVVRDSAINDTISLLQRPPGRKVAIEVSECSDWFNSLTERDRQLLRRAITHAVDYSLFGLFCVLDGVRSVEDRGLKGAFELRYVRGASVLLNTPDGEMLHDLYNDQS